MVKARIAELGDQTFTAYDGDTPVEIKIENSRKRFKNKSGRIVSVNKDLTTKNIDKGIKQEAVVLSDELIYASNYKENAPAHHSHGWLDNNGKNDWEKRTVIIQEKNNSVWEATLHIANAQNGEKILYDIDPIKKWRGPENRTLPPLRIVYAKARKMSIHNFRCALIPRAGSFPKHSRNSSRTARLGTKKGGC